MGAAARHQLVRARLRALSIAPQHSRPGRATHVHADSMPTVACRINNAGTNAYKYGPLLESDDDDLEAIVDTNILGVMLCCKEVHGCCCAACTRVRACAALAACWCCWAGTRTRAAALTPPPLLP